MSRPAGTLITTNNATYIPPRFMPCYKGHVPTLKFDYGETYGNATSKYFQDYRSHTLDTSKSNYCKGGYFPTVYTHNPDLVIGNRTRTQDRWLAAPRYSLTNVDHDRKEGLIRFDRMANAHREHYRDCSGTVQRVDHFLIPNKAEDQFKKHINYLIMAQKYTDDMNLPEAEPMARRKPIIQRFSPHSSVRDRSMRDVYFERR